MANAGFLASDFAGMLTTRTQHNWTDRPVADPNSIIFGNSGRVGVDYQFESLEPTDAKVLAPSATSPQRSQQSGGHAETDIGAIGSQ